MICNFCADNNHEECLGKRLHKTHCDCQHKFGKWVELNGQRSSEGNNEETESVRTTSEMDG